MLERENCQGRSRVRFNEGRQDVLFEKKEGNCPGRTTIGEAKTRGRKRFFFEKKNQKTFDPLGWASQPAPKPNDQTFFAAFFQKSRPCCRLPLLPAGYLGATKEAENFLSVFASVSPG
jgi:hypothetical protein